MGLYYARDERILAGPGCLYGEENGLTICYWCWTFREPDQAAKTQENSYSGYRVRFRQRRQAVGPSSGLVHLSLVALLCRFASFSWWAQCKSTSPTHQETPTYYNSSWTHDVTFTFTLPTMFRRCLPQRGECGRHRQNGAEGARNVCWWKTFALMAQEGHDRSILDVTPSPKTPKTPKLSKPAAQDLHDIPPSLPRRPRPAIKKDKRIKRSCPKA
ncbi:hypothetical protein CORC01_09739 [Colletotrichum orchidophilum]|uniref:Uncharacterized protein n=1 Tax=Colletotrichum orchidophilum TaxID=1209926 RepID=A0A1G4B0T0_9PEZI|nr:uncharacterized protein CORC01_09739 [Colletotrichum orchidophilum]OHE94945.1 hypothetical protein CORC01_09739 [Colletotrichum orchidophilum]